MSSLSNKFMNRMFRKIGGLVWELTTGNLGIKDEHGIHTLAIEQVEGADAPTYGTSVNPFDSFGVSVPAFATNTPIEQVAVGDIIVGESAILGWVIEVRDRSLKLLDKNGMTKNYTPPKVAILGTSGVLVVKNLFNLVGGQNGLAGIQNNLLPMLMLGGDGLDFDKIMPIILMQSMNAPAAGANAAPAANPMAAMLPLMLLSKGGLGGKGDIDPMMLMAMSGGLGGAGAVNPMMLLAMTGGLESKAETISLAPAGIPALSKVSC